VIRGALVLFFCFFPGCSSPELRAGALAWAKCSGGAAVRCIPSAGNPEPKRAAVDYAACLVSRSIGCLDPLPRQNPPGELPAKTRIRLSCVEDVAADCMLEARSDSRGLGTESSGCVEHQIPRCFVGP
jgi:hypothetical protein